MILFVSGIDTGIGKTVATGCLAAWFHRRGWRTITQKLVQTGCADASEDIAAHRRWMRIPLLDEDRQGLTCPAVFPFPGSPHLAAELAGDVVDIERIVACSRELERCFELVLVEGAGGLMVPLTRNTNTIELVTQQGWPVILVTTPRLGSINHTLLSLEAIHARGIRLAAVIYNLHRGAAPEIVADTRQIIREALARWHGPAILLDLPDTAEPDAAIWGHIDLQPLLQ